MFPIVIILNIYDHSTQVSIMVNSGIDYFVHLFVNQKLVSKLLSKISWDLVHIKSYLIVA